MAQGNKLKDLYFIWLFLDTYKRVKGEEYILKTSRFNNKGVFLDSDRIRLKRIRKNLSLIEDNPAYWLEYISRVIKIWQKTKYNKTPASLISFLENQLNYNIDKKHKVTLGGYKVFDKHLQDWDK